MKIVNKNKKLKVAKTSLSLKKKNKPNSLENNGTGTDHTNQLR